MALAVPTSNDLNVKATVETYQAPLPTPTAPPAYVPPTDPYIPPAPMLATPPAWQTLGKGGTYFGAVPQVYAQPPVILYGDAEDQLYGDMPYKPREAVDPQPVEAPPPGTKATMPVIRNKVPPKVPVAAAVDPVEKPGPITGEVAGFNLARIPFWAWLAGAAVLGAKVLK